MRPGLLLWFALAAATAHSEPSLSQAAMLYHQGRYDSALTVLEACRYGNLKRRDSLELFQYSGMAAARLGRAEEASGDFRSLLALDSLFQFPRNENSAILAAFARALEPQPQVSVVHPGPDGVKKDTAAPPSSALAEGRPAMASPMTARLPDAPEADGASGPHPLRVGLAMGAIPFGAGWLARDRPKQGWALAVLQAGGVALSLYASSQITASERGEDGIRDHNELESALRWQWTQRVALSIALGAYLFSWLAARGE